MDCIICGVTKVRHDRATFTFNTFNISGKGLIFKIYKELIELSGKNTNDLVKK